MPQLYCWIATVYALYLAYHPYVTCIAGIEVPPHINASALNILQAGAALEAGHVCVDWRASKPRLLYLSVAAAVIMSGFLLFMLALLLTGQTVLGFLNPAARGVRVYMRHADALTCTGPA